MERRPKQRLSYLACLWNLSLCVTGFRLAHLNRWASSHRIVYEVFMQRYKYFLASFIATICLLSYVAFAQI
jgi:hypothetical protein